MKSLLYRIVFGASSLAAVQQLHFYMLAQVVEAQLKQYWISMSALTVCTLQQ